MINLKSRSKLHAHDLYVRLKALRYPHNNWINYPNPVFDLIPLGISLILAPEKNHPAPFDPPYGESHLPTTSTTVVHFSKLAPLIVNTN